MPIQWMEAAKLVVMLLGGGLAGALLNEWFRRRSSITRDVHLIERVNRLQDELRGVRFVRSASGGQKREVKNLRTYQMTLRNTSRIHLRNSEIQFEFASEDIEPWVSRPARSKTALVPCDALLTPPWKQALRWRVPSLPPDDSVEFSFHVFEPSTEDYEAVIYSDANVVLRRTTIEPKVSRSGFHNVLVPLLAGMLVGVIFNTLFDRPNASTPEQLLKQATATLDGAAKASSDHERQMIMEKTLRLVIKATAEKPPDVPSGPH